MTRILPLTFLLALTLAIALPNASTWADVRKASDKSTSEKEDDSNEKEDDASDDEKDEEDKDNDKASDDKKADKKTDEDGDDKKDAAKSKRKTATVKQQSIKVDVTVDGTFVARNMTPVVLRPEAWSSFKIEEIVPHGAKVNEGEVLVRFDAKKLNEQISDLELSQKISELSLRKAEQELPRLEKSLAMSLTDARQSHERTHEDYKRYKEEDRARMIKSAEMSLKSSKQRLDYARDELNQLEKMYKADDLTEETEEIVLTRSRQAVEFAEYSYELAKNRHHETMNIYLPRQDVDNSEVIDRVNLSLARAELSSQLDLNRARYELEQQRISRDKSTEKHAKLVQDRGLMQLKSPAEGIVYYGQCTNGKWGDMGSMQNKLKPHASVSSGTVMMTIVDPSDMYLLATVAEKERPSIEQGQPARIKSSAPGVRSMSGSVESISSIPVSSGKFALKIDLTSDDRPDWLVPGMSGKIRITTYNKKDALVVDKKAVHTDEENDDKQYVWVVEGDDDQTVKKQRVKTGKSKGDLIEIVDGLDKGDVVSLEDEKKDDDED